MRPKPSPTHTKLHLLLLLRRRRLTTPKPSTRHLSTTTSTTTWATNPDLTHNLDALLQLASREPNPASRVLALLKTSKDQGIPVPARAAGIAIRVLGMSRMPDEAIRVYREVDGGSKDGNLRGLMVEGMARCGRIGDAVKVLDEMLERDTVSKPSRRIADSVFKGWVNSGGDGGGVRDEEMARVVARLGESGVFPDPPRLTQLITRFCEYGRTDLGWEVLHVAMKGGKGVERISCNALLMWLARKGEVGRMNLLMREMKVMGVMPDAVTFGILIKSLCKSSRVDQALEVFERMNRGDDGVEVKPDVAIYNTLIDGLCKAGRQDEGWALMERMKGLGDGCVPNAVTYNSLIDGFCKAGELDKAQELFESMSENGVEPNVRPVNSLIDGMCRHGKLSNALALFKTIKGQGIKGTEVAYTTLIGAFCNVNNIRRAMDLFDEMRKTCTPDAIVYYTLISGLTQAGRMEDADCITQEMKRDGFCPDVRCFNILISGFCKKNKPDKAIELLKEMEAARLKPDVVTYNTLIAFFSQDGNLTLAHELLKRMVKDGLMPTVVTYGALIRAYCGIGDLGAAMKIFYYLCSTSVVSPNTIIYNTLIDSLCRSDGMEDAFRLLDDMKTKDVRPSTNTFNSFFKALQKLNDFDKALELMDRMTEEACHPDYVTMEVLGDWFFAIGKTEKLKKFVHGYKVSGTTGLETASEALEAEKC